MADRNDFDRERYANRRTERERNRDRDRGDWNREGHFEDWVAGRGGWGRERGFGGFGGEQGFGGHGGEHSERRFARSSRRSGCGGGSSWTGGNPGGSSTGGMGTYAEPGRRAARGPLVYQRSGDRIREDVCEYLTQDLDVDASEVDVEVKNGEVTLTGTVDRRERKSVAKEAAAGSA